MEVRNLCFQHHKEAPFFFKDLSFHLEKGKMHALHGKNGIGKTILMNLLSRKADKGAVISGEIIGEHIFLINQRFDQTLADQFSFMDNLKFGNLSYFPHPFSRLKMPSFLPEFLDQFHIDPTTPVHQLSGGQRQILALLMQLQKKPHILLLDEPTAALDEQNAAMVFEFLHSLQDMTFLIVCHDRELVYRFANGTHLHMEMEISGLRQVRYVRDVM